MTFRVIVIAKNRDFPPLGGSLGAGMADAAAALCRRSIKESQARQFTADPVRKAAGHTPSSPASRRFRERAHD